MCHSRAGRIEPTKREYVDLTQKVRDRAIGEILLQLFIRDLSCIACPVFQTIWPGVVRGAVTSISEGSHFGIVAGCRTIRIEIRITGRVGDNIADGDTEGLVKRVGHRVAVDVLASGRVSGDDDFREVGEGVLFGETAEEFVGQIKRVEVGVANGNSTGTPTVAVAGPIDFVVGKFVLAGSL